MSQFPIITRSRSVYSTDLLKDIAAHHNLTVEQVVRELGL